VKRHGTFTHRPRRLRDKVVAFDPATAPADTDAEAAGVSVPAAAEEAADRQQAGITRTAVPKLDPNRAVSPDLATRNRDVLLYVLGAAAVLAISLALLTAAGIGL
jgi:hypothetical protein